MSAQHRLAEVGYDFWEEQYNRATAVGCGELVALDEERVAACDELVAATLAGLLRVGCRLTAAAVTDAPAGHDAAVARETAAVVRLLDRALAAHGRDNGYDVEAWRASAVTSAWALGDDAESMGTLVHDAMGHVADVMVALPRDRLGVPECLSGAIGCALLVYTALGEASP